MNDFEWQAVRDYLDRHTNIVADVMKSARDGNLAGVAMALSFLVDPSMEARDTVEIEYRRK